MSDLDGSRIAGLTLTTETFMPRNQRGRHIKGNRESKHLPSNPSGRLRAKIGLEFGENVALIKAADLDRLKASDDFIDMVRAMRLSNVLNYAFDQVVKEVDQTSSAGRLAFVRSRFNLGGYLHEAIDLLMNLKKRHLGKAYFVRARKTIEALTTREKEILRLFRNNAAFHLDQDNYSTSASLKNLTLRDWEFLVADSSMRKDQYYAFADEVDLNYIIDRLKKFKGAPSRSLFEDVKAHENAILNEAFDVLIRHGREIAISASSMTNGLAKRLGLLR